MDTSQIAMTRRGPEPSSAASVIVCVHGIGSRRQIFEPVIDELIGRGHHVLSLDLPGFGQTPADEHYAAGPIGYADWLTDLFVELSIERPHMVGNSMGGGIALELGRRGVAGQVTAFSPIGFWDRPGVWWSAALLTTLRFSGRATPVMDVLLGHKVTRSALLGAAYGKPAQISPADARADVAALVGSTSFEAALRKFFDFSIDAGTDLGALPTMPVTVAWGTRDLLLTHRTQSRRARQVMPFARHLDLPGAGHVPFGDDPSACAAAVLG